MKCCESLPLRCGRLVGGGLSPLGLERCVESLADLLQAPVASAAALEVEVLVRGSYEVVNRSTERGAGLGVLALVSLSPLPLVIVPPVHALTPFLIDLSASTANALCVSLISGRALFSSWSKGLVGGHG